MNISFVREKQCEHLMKVKTATEWRQRQIHPMHLIRKHQRLAQGMNVLSFCKRIRGINEENLYKIWEKDLKMNLDLTQRKWIEDCIKGTRKMNIISRHNNHFISQQQMMKPQTNHMAKGMDHTLDDLNKDDYTTISKALMGDR